MDESPPPETEHLMTEGFFSGPCFGDESPSNLVLDLVETSPSPLCLDDFKGSKHNLLLGRTARGPSPTNPNEDHESRISLKNKVPEPTDTILPISSSITHNIETQPHRQGDNCSEQLPIEGTLSQSPNSRQLDFCEKVPENLGNNSPMTGISSPLIDPEQYNSPYGIILGRTVDVVPESVGYPLSPSLLSEDDDENTDNVPPLEAIEKSLLNSTHSSLFTGQEFMSSSPPTSSPPRIFSSSPFASSQASDDSQSESLEHPPKYPENFLEKTSNDERNLPAVILGGIRHDGHPGSLPADVGDSADISHSPIPSYRSFPRAESLTHYPSFVPSDNCDGLEDGVKFATKHIAPQLLPRDPELLSLTQPNSNAFTHDGSPKASSNNSLVSHPCSDPHDILSTSLTSEHYIEEQSTITEFDTSPQSSPTPNSLPSSSPLGSLLLSSPLSKETGPIQSALLINIPATASMNITMLDNEEVLLLSPHHQPSQGPSHSSSLTEMIMFQDVEPSWVPENDANGIVFENTKPCDVEEIGDSNTNSLDLPSGSNAALGKRKRDDAEIVCPKSVDSTTPLRAGQGFILQVHPTLFVGEGPGLKAGETKVQTKVLLPNPKRSTMASQKLQHKKLATPFRSPVLKRPKMELSLPLGQSNHAGGHSLTVDFKGPEARVKSDKAEVSHGPIIGTSDTKKRHRTQRAGGQFKSPLSLDASSRATSSLVRLTPTIQTLERKLQTLKRAIKVKHDRDEEALEALVKKWTEAGREVAWEIWELVKDNASNDDGNWGQPKRNAGKRPFEESWGWEDKEHQKAFVGQEKERNWGWDVVPRGDDSELSLESDEKDLSKTHGEVERYQDEDEEKQQDTLGTMLMQLGIAPDTLGWNEEEGVFVGE